MRGGLKVYRGAAAAARHYVEADRGRADDYYLAEGTGIAERYVASPAEGVRLMEPLTGDEYEAWVAGVHPDTGAPKGRLRHDANAVRFVEVVVNGPKSWSLAAELHPDISAAYDAAQDTAARQIIGWLAEHATTRIGPRGAQIQVPVAAIDAVTVRHYTSRAGDPHRHLHLQINARVLAEGRWRGLHTVGVRDSLDAINGIGHAAMTTDPGFRAALAAHGFTLDPATGEIAQLAEFVGPFSARAAQIGRNFDRYEADWRAANPGREPGPALRRSWDARAWRDARPDKIVPSDGADLTHRWVTELRDLGYRDARSAASIDAASVGSIDRTEAVDECLARLAARRSAWNSADIRGEVELLIARRNVVTDPVVRREVAEDLTARALVQCVSLLDRHNAPEHIRAVTSRHVLDVETELTGRLAARAANPATGNRAIEVHAAANLDAAQHEVVTALGSDRELIVVEGAAGAGKTKTLAAARDVLEQSGRRLIVVTPTLKAARVAAAQVGSAASSAAWLAHQHGFRWAEDGVWTRLVPGQTDPTTGITFTGPNVQATLRRGDLLLVDEAGMLDQDTACALLTIADEQHARVALVGDRHQLPAVGRGGVLELATRWAPAESSLTLDTVHRFARPVSSPDGIATREPDEQYAQLSLAMRAANEPDDVFDALVIRGQIRLHASEDERRDALAGAAVDAIVSGESTAVLADTREEVANLNDLIRGRLVAAGNVDDARAVTTASGQRIGVGDRVATRRNAHELQVANRDVWTVVDVATDGKVTVDGPLGKRSLPVDYVREHLELAYAATIYGAQGETTSRAHLRVGEHTTGSSAYVGMTRGRESNVAHLVADTVDDAREQWVAVFARERADLGPSHAADLAEQEASRYARLRSLDDVLPELHAAWSAEADCLARLADAEQRHDLLVEIVAVRQQRDGTVPVLQQAYESARAAAQQAAAVTDHLEHLVSAHAEDVANTLQRDWDSQRDAARRAAQVVRDGPGRFGQRSLAVRRAVDDLMHWSATWQPYLPTMPTRAEDVAAFADWFDDTPRIRAAFERYGRVVAERGQPDYLVARDAAEHALAQRDEASRNYREAVNEYSVALSRYGRLGQVDDPAGRLAHTEQQISDLRVQAGSARDRASRVLADPTLRVLPTGRIAAERDCWQADRDAAETNLYAEPALRERREASRLGFDHHAWTPSTPDHGPSIGR
jgi:conjugative relaxase-like TrwC/TraI family protein